MNKIDVVLSTNERYMPGATVALVSMALNARKETRLVFHVFTEKVERESLARMREAILRVHAESVLVEHVCGEELLSGLSYWAGSRMTWVRCFYAKLLPDVDWALYVDCDILYLASPEEHFALRDDSVYVCASPDMADNACQADAEWCRRKLGKELVRGRYFNAGVLLINFKKFREDSIPEKISEFIKQNGSTPFVDQSVMNMMFSPQTVKMLPSKYNFLQVFLDDVALNSRPIVHYVGGIPWLSKYGAVANGRFALWHAFADKYVWRKNGESVRRCMSRKAYVIKRLLCLVLKTPVIGFLFEMAVMKIGVVKGTCWRESQVANDISDFEEVI